MSATELQHLAALIGRPVHSLQAFSVLSETELALLRQSVEAACAQQRQALDAAFRKALPAPLRWLALRILRGESR